MKRILKIVFILIWVVFAAFILAQSRFNYRNQEMVLREIGDIRLPSSCHSQQYNEGNKYFRVDYCASNIEDSGIKAIEEQLINKGFVRMDDKTLLKGKIKAFRYKVNGKTILTIHYENE